MANKPEQNRDLFSPEDGDELLQEIRKTSEMKKEPPREPEPEKKTAPKGSDDLLAKMFEEETARQNPVDLTQVFNEPVEEEPERRPFGWLSGILKNENDNSAARREREQEEHAKHKSSYESIPAKPAEEKTFHKENSAAPKDEPAARKDKPDAQTNRPAEPKPANGQKNITDGSERAGTKDRTEDTAQIAEEKDQTPTPPETAPGAEQSEAAAAAGVLSAFDLSEADEDVPSFDVLFDDERTEEAAPQAEKKGKRTTLIRTAAILTAICAGVALLLAVINGTTKDRIAQNLDAEKRAAILQVFPDGEDIKPYTADSGEEVYLVTRGGELIGCCVDTVGTGYIGDIGMMVGIDAAHRVTGIRIVDIKETPGTGMKVQSEIFLKSFAGLDEEAVIGENVDGISGATRSSEGVAQGVNKALAVRIDFEKAARSLNTSVYVPEKTEPEPPESTVEPENGNDPINVGEAGEVDSEPVETEPHETEPPETEPVETEPPETEPPETEPVETEPAETEPPETEPQETEPPETEPPAVTPPVETPPVETPPVETPPVETPPVETPPVETPPVETPPVETPPVETPPVETPPVETPPVETPPVETPPVETPPVETPPVETPPVETPPVETPPVETPPVETPPVETPPVETPPVETPPVETPPVDEQPPETEPEDTDPTVEVVVDIDITPEDEETPPPEIEPEPETEPETEKPPTGLIIRPGR